MSREGRSQPVQPAAWHGFVDPGPGPVGTTPAAPVVVENPADRLRRTTAPPIVLSGVLATSFAAPTATPPAPLVVPVEWSRRVTQQPAVSHGFDDALPPQPEVVLVDARRSIPLPPTVVSGALAPFFPVFVAPPPPVVVFVEGRRRLVPQPVVLAGPAFPTGVVGAIYTQRFGGPHPGEAGLVGSLGANTFGRTGS